MNRLIIYMAAAAALLLAGCRSTRTAGTAGGDYTSPGGGVTVASVAANYGGQWTQVSVPVTLRLLEPYNLSVSARARMVRGSCIDLSFRMLGFEVARVWISPDSVVAVSRPKKICFTESLADIVAGLPVNLGNMQDMLMGRPFVPGGATLALADTATMSLDNAGGTLRLLPRQRLDEADYGYAVDSCAAVTALAVIVPYPDATFTATYAGRRSLDAPGTVADTSTLALATPNADYSASVAWKWGSANCSNAAAIEPPSTAGLRRVTFAELIKMVKSL